MMESTGIFDMGVIPWEPPLSGETHLKQQIDSHLGRLQQGNAHAAASYLQELDQKLPQEQNAHAQNLQLFDAERDLVAVQHPLSKAPERITISDDRSAGSNMDVRNLTALKDRTGPRSTPDPGPPSGVSPTSYGNRIRTHAIGTHINQKNTTIISDESDYQRVQSSLGRRRLQQRFGRLHFEHVPADGVHVPAEEDPKDHPTAHTFLKSPRISQPKFVPRGQWIDDVERTDTSSQIKLAHIQMLQQKIVGMQKELQDLEEQKLGNMEKQYQVIYRIGRTCYFDHPEWTQGRKSIVSRIPVKNLDLFLEKNKNIVFIVYRDFEPSSSRKRGTKIACAQPKNVRESIRPTNRRLRKIFETMLAQDWRYDSYLQHLRKTGEIDAPYLFVFHKRRNWKDMMEQFPRAVQEHLNLFAIYVSDNYGDEYTAADALFARRELSIELVKYFFQPGDILVSRAMGEFRGYVADSWPQDSPSATFKGSRHPWYQPVARGPTDPHWQSDDDDSDFESDDVGDENEKDPDLIVREIRMRASASMKKEMDKESVSVESSSEEFPISVYKWSFDGDFKREADKLVLKLSHPEGNASLNTRTWSIDDLEVYPLSFAPPEVVQKLHRRGTMFWKCRKQCLMSYRETSADVHNESDERFVIDFRTFKKLHPENKGHAIINSVETLSQTEMEQPEPPDEAFYYLVPPQSKGFNLRTKKWLDLNMDQVHPVVWNQQAFDSLVLDQDRKTKELITALVSKQISAAKSTDVIAGKGNGLILLLHGGPGTGKTLTAEGVAEIAKKPLYRSVLHLGKIWDCVVLLDEAEVFLERRSLDNLQRNALVSVFLRVIEYHEGILILTSNRVGTFDEAFRSRIQIAIHYPPLRPFQRLQIWRNFFDRLESFKDGKVDVDELRDHLEELQGIEINGRQIRNAITTARQYAEWKEKGPMNYEHLKIALDVAGRFNTYSEKLRGGLTDDQIAEEEGIR
ncbi:AAA family ATPase [Paraphaeosphaeria sporulosa]